MTAGLAICAVVVTACGSGSGSGKGSTTGGGTSSPESASTPSTTSTVAVPVAVLTGLPLADSGLRSRPILVVKIDNAPEARPQFGIDRADDIVEEKVEGGISRFMAIFQSEDANQVGPVRSLRSTDPAWLKPEGAMIAYSGGIPEVKALLGPAGIVDLGADSHGTTYYKRRSDRPFEHSLWVNTTVLRQLTPRGVPAPKPLYQYLAAGQTFAGSGSGSVPVVSISGSMADGAAATHFDWTWDAGKHAFLRGTDSKPAMIENVGQIAMPNVIVQFTQYQPTPWRDRANSPVDEAVVTGQGDAWVLSNGQLVKGHWSRPSPNDITTFTDATGAPILLQPGHTWLSLVPAGRAVNIVTPPVAPALPLPTP